MSKKKQPIDALIVFREGQLPSLFVASGPVRVVMATLKRDSWMRDAEGANLTPDDFEIVGKHFAHNEDGVAFYEEGFDRMFV